MVIDRKEAQNKPSILFLDDDESRISSFVSKYPNATIVRTAEEAIAALVDPWDNVLLDHDLGGEQYVESDREDTGMGVVRWIAKNKPSVKSFFIHSHNPAGATNMESLLLQSGYNVRKTPFAWLINQI